ncbi:MAG: hypothetical protein AAGC60_24295 [Acidobacteriota bacterium]
MIVARAPLRLSFFGGGSDFPEVFERQPGAVLSTAIDLSVHVSVRRPPAGAFERPLRLVHAEIEEHDDVAEIRHPLLRSALERRGVEPPLEIHSSGDLPAGLGLGSSSSFCVALLTALDALEGHRRSPLERAYEAIALERAVCGGTVGVQDQVIASLGGMQRFDFHAVDDVRATTVALDAARREALERHLVLVRVGAARSAPRVERRKLERLAANASALRGMVALVDSAFDLLAGDGPLEPLGALLDATWAAKRRLAPGVTTPEIDALYRACRAAGALGGKLLGAGAGGFLLLFAPPEVMPAVLAATRTPDGQPRVTLRPRLAAPGAHLLTNETVSGANSASSATKTSSASRPSRAVAAASTGRG